jgi:hypothetical protein
MNAQFKRLKPAALSRQILTLTSQLETLAQAKAAPRDYKVNTWFNPSLNRTFSREATTHRSGPIDMRQQGGKSDACGPCQRALDLEHVGARGQRAAVHRHVSDGAGPSELP